MKTALIGFFRSMVDASRWCLGKDGSLQRRSLRRHDECCVLLDHQPLRLLRFLPCRGFSGAESPTKCNRHARATLPILISAEKILPRPPSDKKETASRNPGGSAAQNKTPPLQPRVLLMADPQFFFLFRESERLHPAWHHSGEQQETRDRERWRESLGECRSACAVTVPMRVS